MRLWHLATPRSYMFDEVYYAKDAKAIVDGRVRPKPPYRWEAGDEVSWPHPEYGKFAIALGIILFGDRSFGWRVPCVVAGMVMLACVYPLARRLGLSPPWALAALLLAAADPLGIVQSRIATLDIFVAVWTVLCIYLTLRYAQDGRRPVWLFAAGVAGGMALGTKWSGGLAVIAALLILLTGWIWSRTRRSPESAAPAVTSWTALSGAAAPQTSAPGQAPGEPSAGPEQPAWSSPGPLPAPLAPARAVPVEDEEHGRGTLASLGLVLLAFVVLPLALYLLSYTQYFLLGHTWADWRELQRQMYIFNLHLHATHTYASSAPTWIVDYRPVWYYFKEVAGGDYRGIVAIGNPLLWWLATVCLVAAPLLWLARRVTLLLPTAAVIAVLYLPWFLASRTSFLYYMTPVAPFLAILVAAALMRASGDRLPPRVWTAGVAAAVLTAVLWDPVVRAVKAVTPLGVAAGIVAALGVLAVLFLPRLRPARPWLAVVLTGVVVGIVVAFIPVVLALRITPTHFSHITWFRSWI